MSENRINSYRSGEATRWPHGIDDREYEPRPPLQSASLQDLYAVAWALAKRDCDMNRLFNGPFDYEI